MIIMRQTPAAAYVGETQRQDPIRLRRCGRPIVEAAHGPTLEAGAVRVKGGSVRRPLWPSARRLGEGVGTVCGTADMAEEWRTYA
ncbi:hypothetical protein NDU88_007935 [Pleurodeles waltl]|uniref:Uncharacterized protein n=1 Tax=Pleurodeles waltl TaxID=8319 RepID=A0AAV7RUM5_PLEWA|nr:hypothetical protein NDU88_007935 [Pleurodeles waltl]